MKMKAKWLPAIAAPAVLVFGLTAPGGGAPSNGNVTSAFRAGYAASVKSGAAVKWFKYIQATFTVPALNCGPAASGSAYQAVYIGGSSGGLDDFGAVYEICQNGTPSYTAVDPGPCDGDGATMPVNPGDDVQITVSFTGEVTITDLTTNTPLVGALGTTCGEPRSEAGVITWSPSGSGSSVADFTQAGFRQIQVQGCLAGSATFCATSTTPQPLAYSGWNLTHYILQGASGRADVKPEALLSGSYTSAFANDWLNAN
jgi:hypothetical protein